MECRHRRPARVLAVRLSWNILFPLEFTVLSGYPGDLVKIAAAGCAVSSSRFPVDHTIGSDAPLSADIDAAYDKDEDRFTDFSENITVDASGSDLSDADAETLAKRVRAYIEKQCTVAHTYRQATPVTISVTVKR